MGLSLAEPRPHRSDAGTNIPVARIRSCETGLSWGRLLLSGSKFPRLGRMFMAHLHRWALAFFGLWVRRLLGQRGGIGTASTCEADRPTRVAPRAKVRAPGRVAVRLHGPAGWRVA